MPPRINEIPPRKRGLTGPPLTSHFVKSRFYCTSCLRVSASRTFFSLLLFICRSKSDLLYYAEYLPTISTQLKIISSVKAATPSDISVCLTLIWKEFSSDCHRINTYVLLLHQAQQGEGKSCNWWQTRKRTSKGSLSFVFICRWFVVATVYSLIC